MGVCKHFVSSRRMSVYDPIHQISMWAETFKSNGNLSASMPLIDEADMKFVIQSEDASHGILGTCNMYDQEGNNLLIRYKGVLHKIERLLIRAVCGKRLMCRI